MAVKLFRRSDSSYWWFSVKDPETGKRRKISTGLKSKVEASAKAVELIADIMQAQGPKRPISVRQALEAYVEHQKTEGRAGIDRLESVVRKILGETKHPDGRDRWRIDGNRLLHTLDRDDLAILKRSRGQEGCNPTTIRHEIQVLRAATKLAVAHKRRGPTELLDPSKRNPWGAPKPVTKTRYLSWADFLQLYRYLDPKRPRTMAGGGKKWEAELDPHTQAAMQTSQDLLVALTLTGGRWSEVATLTWDRVDLKTRTIRLWGNKTKTERVVAIPAMLREVLERRHKASTGKPGEPVFPTRDGKVRNTDTCCRPILRAIEACGLNKDPMVLAAHGRATVHSLRHTYASWLAQQGATLQEVQMALGHSTTDMTLRYAHLIPTQAQARVRELLDGVTTTETEAKEAV